jgi:hypothetical protein
MLARCFVEKFYDPEDGGDTFLRNDGYHSTHYTASNLLFFMKIENPSAPPRFIDKAINSYTEYGSSDTSLE